MTKIVTRKRPNSGAGSRKGCAPTRYREGAIATLRQRVTGSCGILIGGSCHLFPQKNPALLPDKWARTSVVTILQQLHNPKVEIPNTLGRARRCTANSALITFWIVIFECRRCHSALGEHPSNDVPNLAHTMFCPLEFGESILMISRSVLTVI